MWTPAVRRCGPFYDWTHGETGAEVLKAQHPEFELWSQGIHARSGVSCAIQLDITQATCAADELTRGRALVTADRLATYQAASESVPDNQRKARFVIVPPKSATSLSFVTRADAPSPEFADLLAYVAELTARYQP